MSTRGAYGFRINGRDKITYNHCDSYPTWLGKKIVDFIQTSSLEEMRQIASRIILVRQDDIPTPEQIEECKEWADLGVGKRTLTDWYCLLRNAQGDLSAYAKGLRYMIDNHTFLADSLFCEWAYIVNLDECAFEVYVGFQKRRDNNPRNRYRNMQKQGEYYPVKLVAEFPLQEIPGDWIKKLKKKVTAKIF